MLYSCAVLVVSYAVLVLVVCVKHHTLSLSLNTSVHLRCCGPPEVRVKLLWMCEVTSLSGGHSVHFFTPCAEQERRTCGQLRTGFKIGNGRCSGGCKLPSKSAMLFFPTNGVRDFKLQNPCRLKTLRGKRPIAVRSVRSSPVESVQQ